MTPPDEDSIKATLCQTGQLCDAILRTEDGREFKVHRQVMAACSMYFVALFSNHPDRQEFKLPGVSAAMLRLLVRWAYTRQLAVDSMPSLLELVIAADQFNVTGVLHHCCDLLKTYLTPDNCIGIRRFARNYFCADLERAATRYLTNHFLETAATSLEFPEMEASDLAQVLDSPELNVREEWSAWEALTAWVYTDVKSRAVHVPLLLRSVRVWFLPESQLHQIRDHPLVVGNRHCKPVMREILKMFRQIRRLRRPGVAYSIPPTLHPRRPASYLLVLGGWSGSLPTAELEAFDIRANRWIEILQTDPLGPRAYHKCAILHNLIYVIGGCDDRCSFSSCRRLDPVTMEWGCIAPLNTRRCYVSVTVCKDVIYAIGGHDGRHRLSSAEKYDRSINQWFPIASMTVQRSDAGAATLDDVIYVTGGFNGDHWLDSVEIYRPDIDQWTGIPPMSTRRSGVSCIGHRGLLYVMGGFNGTLRLNSAECFDPQQGEWAELRNMHHCRSNFAVAVLEDLIFAIGGYNGTTTISRVEFLNPQSGEWHEAVDLALHRSAGSACVVAGLSSLD